MSVFFVTALDAVGPYEVLARLPGARVTFAAPARGVVRTDKGALGLVADAARAPEALREAALARVRERDARLARGLGAKGR